MNSLCWKWKNLFKPNESTEREHSQYTNCSELEEELDELKLRMEYDPEMSLDDLVEMLGLELDEEVEKMEDLGNQLPSLGSIGDEESMDTDLDVLLKDLVTLRSPTLRDSQAPRMSVLATPSSSFGDKTLSMAEKRQTDTFFEMWLEGMSQDEEKPKETSASSRVSNAMAPKIPTALTLSITYKGTSIPLTVETEITVQDVMDQICDVHPVIIKERQSMLAIEYGLFVPYPIGSWLTPSVKLSKYGFKDWVSLVFFSPRRNWSFEFEVLTDLNNRTAKGKSFSL